MPQKIEAPGTYIGTIVESGLALSSKTGIPQWVARLRAEKRFIESPADIEWFQKNKGLLTDGKAAYVEWTEYDEDILAYLALYSFKVKQEISPDTELLNAKQLNIATGWQAPDFESLATLVGKQILFRVEYESYTSPEGKVTEGNKVTWIDKADASPTRQLKTLDQGGIKDLMTKVTGYAVKGKPAASAATFKPPTPARASVPSAPVSEPNQTVSVSPAPPLSTASAAPASAKPPAKRQKKAEPAPVKVMDAHTGAPFADPPAPASTTQIDAWNFVNANKAAADDDEVAKAWTDSCEQVLGAKDEAKATGEDWAAVRDAAVAKLAALCPV